MIICVDREPWFTVTGNGENPSIVIPGAMQHAMLLCRLNEFVQRTHGANHKRLSTAAMRRRGSRISDAALHAASHPG